MRLHPILVALPLLVAAPFVAGCFGGGNVGCTDDFRYGLIITLKDPSGAAICDATVTVVDGAYRETLTELGCSYGGAGERPGNYTVTITRSGFATKTLDVGVAADTCHVHTEQRNVTLTP